MNLFKEFWKAEHGGELFEKAGALTKAELAQVQGKIAELQKKGLPSSKIIASLQRFNGKLSEKWRAERAYWTEVKLDDREKVGEIGDDLGIAKYKIILSPNACKLCRMKSNGGRKVFSQKDMEKTGYGNFVPWHPNCYCIAIPIA